MNGGHVFRPDSTQWQKSKGTHVRFGLLLNCAFSIILTFLLILENCFEENVEGRNKVPI